MWIDSAHKTVALSQLLDFQKSWGNAQGLAFFPSKRSRWEQRACLGMLVRDRADLEAHSFGRTSVYMLGNSPDKCEVKKKILEVVKVLIYCSTN